MNDVALETNGLTRYFGPYAAVDHLDHICSLVGNADHAALGTDLDGGFGRELAPTDYDTAADLQRFPGILRCRGYGDEDIAGICHGTTRSAPATPGRDSKTLARNRAMPCKPKEKSSSMFSSKIRFCSSVMTE